MRYGRVRFDYESDSVGHLKLKKGEILQLQSQPNQGLWKGKKTNSSETGFFPHNYVDVLSSQEDAVLSVEHSELSISDAQSEDDEEETNTVEESISQRVGTGRFAKVLYEFNSTTFSSKGNLKCLDVKEGEYVKIVSGDKGNGWILVHKLTNGANGVIPSSYVSLLPLKARVLFSFDPGSLSLSVSPLSLSLCLSFSPLLEFFMESDVFVIQ